MLGHSPSVKFPCVLGIECVGEIEDNGGNSQYKKGDVVAAAMGEMGRQFDGGYAEYTLVPLNCVSLPINKPQNLSWEVLASIPEMFLTTWGTMVTVLNATKNDTVLIRGGTSSVGMACITLAKSLGCVVAATTRNTDKVSALKDHGVDHVIIDQGNIAQSVKEIFPKGVDKVVELIGTATLNDSLKCAKAPGGIVCMTGILAGSWTIKEFEPMSSIPTGVYLSCFSSDTLNIKEIPLNEYINKVANGEFNISVDKVFNIKDIVKAHEYMESNVAKGKIVVVVD
jgi:NADPH2:quinone reductase